MKHAKLFLAAAALVVSSSAFAQDIEFGVKAGINISNFNTKYDGHEENDDTKSKLGLCLGAYADFNFTDMFALEAGLQFDQIGAKNEWSEDDESEKFTTNINYLSIPVNFRANLPVGDNKLYFLAGPTFGIAVSGKGKSEITYNGKTKKNEEKLKLGNSEGDENNEGDDCKRINMGFLLGAGFEMSNNIGIRLSYDLGMSNILPGGDKDNSVKSKVFSLALTYKF